MSTFTDRHRNKFLWLGGTVAAGYAIVNYAKYKWNEAIRSRGLELSARSNLKYRFELNIKDCHFVVESLLPSLKDNIFQELNVEFLTSQLKQKQVDSNTLLEESKKQKREMWNELKIQAICRTIAAIYLLNLLTLFTTVQLSLLGRILYLDSVRALASSAQTSDLDPKQGTNTFRSISEEIERQYLTLSWYILNIGWKQCVERIRKAVLKHTMMVPLTMAFTHDSLMELIYNIRQDVDHENGQLFRFDTFLLPVEGSEGFVFSQGGVSKTDTLDPSLQLLLDETRDFLESNDFTFVFKNCVDEASIVLKQELEPTFFDQTPKKMSKFEAGDDDPLDKQSKLIPIAGILPLMAKMAHQITSTVPNLFLDVRICSSSLFAIILN